MFPDAFLGLPEEAEEELQKPDVKKIADAVLEVLYFELNSMTKKFHS